MTSRRLRCLLVCALLVAGASAQQARRQRQNPLQQRLQMQMEEEKRKRPSSFRDLFNTTSCIDPPFTCPHYRIQFYLYTRISQDSPQLLDVTDQASLHNSFFDARNPVKLVIHGFGGGRDLSPSTDMRRAYFQYGEYNVVVADFSTLVKEPCLSQLEWSPRFCAECIAQFVDYLAAHPRGVPPDRLHLIGYSMGAHIAGLVANHVTASGKLGRITGLDPTIFIYMGSNRSRDLDPSDAHFVDVIHTGAGVLGQWGPNGHADFYVNGGTSQPGCASMSLFKTLSCDHTKVTPYFIESINSKAGFWASPCTSQLLYFLGWCTPSDQDYILMGEHAPHTARGLFYLSTNARRPYAKGFPGKRKPRKGDARNLQLS
ncbi:inactive pancreatic lipase-related protein 1-like [Bacillus rossius redtenbacheri]|uniref:inactive pancreatic lipase-related protein 1-like n=1 Tax=Bacillus rossius redtenbacheri TaxID=93214 RepID=UPI002FDDA2C8